MSDIIENNGLVEFKTICTNGIELIKFVELARETANKELQRWYTTEEVLLPETKEFSIDYINEANWIFKNDYFELWMFNNDLRITGKQEFDRNEDREIVSRPGRKTHWLYLNKVLYHPNQYASMVGSNLAMKTMVKYV